MLHVWLIPVAIVGALALLGFYMIIRHGGGSGIRSEGRTVVDKPDEEPPLDQ